MHLNPHNRKRCPILKNDFSEQSESFHIFAHDPRKTAARKMRMIYIEKMFFIEEILKYTVYCSKSPVCEHTEAVLAA